MTAHRYSMQQLVRLTRPSLPGWRANEATVYEITRLMPADQTGEVSYRIRESNAVGGERAVRESEITSRLLPAGSN